MPTYHKMKLPSRLLNRGIYVGVVATLLLIAAAYQFRPAYTIIFGGVDDTPMIDGFNTREVMAGEKRIPFRWTTGDSWVTLQDVGIQEYDAVITLSGGRPQSVPPAQVIIEANGQTLLRTAPAAGLIDYSMKVPIAALEGSTLRLHIIANEFTPPGDPRTLGVTVTQLKVSPAAGHEGFIGPPVEMLLALCATAGLLGIALSLLGWGRGTVGLASTLVGVLAAGLTIYDRLWLTSRQWYLSWAEATAVAVIFILLARYVGGWGLRAGGVKWGATDRRGLLTLLLVSTSFLVAGQMHPRISIIDLGFHVHNLERIEEGTLLFKTVAYEWGGKLTYYLPTTYLFMVPFHWLLQSEELAVKLFTVTLGVTSTLLVFYLGSRVFNRRVGLFSSMLYLTLPIGVLPYSWGITSNLFGDVAVLATLAVAVGACRNISPRRGAFWLLAIVLLTALLSHPGDVQMVSVAFGLTTMAIIVRDRKQHKEWALGSSGAVWALSALLLAAGVAYLLYYRNTIGGMLSTLGEINSQRAAQKAPGIRVYPRVGGALADLSLGLVYRQATSWRDWFFGGIDGFWREAVAFYKGWAVAGALLGLALVLPGSPGSPGYNPESKDDSSPRTGAEPVSERAERLEWFMLAAFSWLATVIIFAVIGWVANLYVRYSLFALPIVAIGGGILLSALWGRSSSARFLSALMLAFFAISALGFWYFRINHFAK